jgi:C-terminal processing protease CtpA/Prc
VDTQKDIPLVLENPNDSSRITAIFTLRKDTDSGDERDEPNFDYSIDSSAGVGVFALHQCVYDEEYKNGLRDFFTAVQENNIRSVIVDLRSNPGGNSLVANEFIRYLPAESYFIGASEVRFGSILRKNKPQSRENQQLTPVFSGDVYVLTGADTFSSATDFATLISDNKLGTVVGEVPGNMPSSYGDILYFQTPNAGLVFTVSYKYFIRPDASKSDSPLIPDVAVHAKDALIETIRLIRKGS